MPQWRSLLAALVFAIPLQAAEGNRYALLVGVQSYANTELRDLSYTEDDVEELAKVLLASGYLAENVKVLTKTHGDKDASRQPIAANIRSELAALVKKVQRGDLVIVAFAGHGFQPRGGKEFFFCPQKCNLDDKSTLVPLNEVYQQLASCADGYKLLLADACRNDLGERGGTRPVENLESVTRPPAELPPSGVMAFYSCSAGEFAYEPADLRHGVFFHYLIEGLKGKADWNADGEITRPELEHYVMREVNSFVVRKLRRQQRPYFMGETNDLRPLVRWSSAEKAPAVVVGGGEAEVKRDPSLLLSEDFRGVRENGRPDGWDAPNLRVIKDTQKRLCLESSSSEGMQLIRLPKLPIKGDFFVECEFALHHGQQLDLQMESLGYNLPIEVTYTGQVALGDHAPRYAEGYKANAVNRLCLVRERDIYRVSINDAVALGGPLPYKGGFDTVRLDVSAGSYYGTAKIYSMKVGQLALVAGAPEPEPARAGTVLLEENFRKAPRGDLPDGWDAETVSVQKDKADRFCLESRAKSGWQYVKLPPVALRGDFLVEFEFELRHAQSLGLRLEGWSDAVPLSITHAGQVTLADNRTWDAASFRPNGLNRFRLTREGDRYRVTINDRIAGSSRIPYTGSFEGVRLGFSGGDSYGTVKIFAMKVATLAATDGRDPPPARAGKVLVDETFRKIEPGDLPAGWQGPTISVQKDSGGRSCLESNAKEGVQHVKLPRLALAGDFFFECEFLLNHAQSLVVRLEGPGPPLPIKVVHTGEVTLGSGRPQQASSFHSGSINLLRLVRKGNTYRVSVNDLFVVGGPYPYQGLFEWAYFDVPAGGSYGTAKIYSVRAGVPGSAAAPAATTEVAAARGGLRAGVREDFTRIEAGSLPPGWTSEGGNLAVQKAGNRMALALTASTPLGDAVVLPGQNLPGDFAVECEFDMPSENATLIMQVEGPENRVLRLRFNGNRVFYLQDRLKGDASKAWKKGEPNVLRLERAGGKAYVVKVNGTQVISLPVTGMAKPFETVRIGMAAANKNEPSPRVYAVRVEPAESGEGK